MEALEEDEDPVEVLGLGLALGRTGLAPSRLDAGKLEKAPDQCLHPIPGLDDERDVLVRVLVEPARYRRARSWTKLTIDRSGS